MKLHPQGKDKEQKVHARNHYGKKIKDCPPTVTAKAAQPSGSKSEKDPVSAFVTMRNCVPASTNHQDIAFQVREAIREEVT